MKGHSDTVTGMSLSPDGSYLLSNSMDNSLRIWDVRPFAPSERCLKILTGHQHNFEKVRGGRIGIRGVSYEAILGAGGRLLAYLVVIIMLCSQEIIVIDISLY